MGVLRLSKSLVILLLFMIILCSFTFTSEKYSNSSISNTNELTVHGRNIGLDCLDNTSSGDCDNDSLSNIEEDRDDDGNWFNDDSDGDGIPNYLDEDDDNDGWPTWMECPISSEQSHDDCPGFGPIKDYLHDNLYNCDLPFVHLAYATEPYEMKLFVFIEHNSSLIELLHLIGEGGANSDRSHLDGKIHWVNASSILEERHHRSWTPVGIVDEGSINTSNGFFRADFDEDGGFVAQHNNSLFIMNLETNQLLNLGELNQSTGGGGDLIIDQSNDIFLISHRGEIFKVTDSSLNATLIGNISHIDGFSSHNHIKGTTVLENGSLLYNAGENIYLIDGEWNLGFNETGYLTNGEKLQIYHIHSSTDSTTGGDMASCLIPDSDQDLDLIPDYYEERVFLTNSTSYDTDLDGLSDGDEILLHGTNPLNNDTDGDGCNDSDEINNFSTNPFIKDTDEDGVHDCLMPTTLNYFIPEKILWDEVNVEWLPEITGHEPKSWSIMPNPPSWLNFEDGILSGTPSSQYYNETFVITCYGDGGQAQDTIKVEVIAPPPVIGYDENLSNHTIGDYIEINVTSFRGPIESWQLSNEIPEWLQFDEGNFSGIAEQSGWLNLTVTAYGVSINDGGTGSNSSSSISIFVQVDIDNSTDDDEDSKPGMNFYLCSGLFLLFLILTFITGFVTYRLTRNEEEDEKTKKIQLLKMKKF